MMQIMILCGCVTNNVINECANIQCSAFEIGQNASSKTKVSPDKSIFPKS